MTIRYKQSTFDAGELSPQVRGRTDLAKRSAGLGLVKNFIALAHGPLTRRSGTEFVDAVRDSNHLARMIPFEFGRYDAYMVVMSGGRFRYYRKGAVVRNTHGGILEDTYPYLENEILFVDVAQSADTLFLAHNNFQPRTLSRHTHVDWRLEVINHKDGPFMDTNLTTTSLVWYPDVSPPPPPDPDPAPAAAAAAAHPTTTHPTTTPPAFPPLPPTPPDITENINEFGHVYEGDGPVNGQAPPEYGPPTYDPPGEIEEPAPIPVAGDPVAIWSTSTNGINDGKGFSRSDDIGRLVSIKSGDVWGVAQITHVSNKMRVRATLIVPFEVGSENKKTKEWRLGIWTQGNGYPRTVTFAFDRLCWGGSTKYPFHTWLSKVSEYTSHALDSPITDASALTLILSSGKLNAIQWMRFPRRLTVGTSGGEWWMTDATGNGPITAESKMATPGSGHGVSWVKPVELGNILVFLQRHEGVVRELFYEFENDSFAGDELTVLAEHLTKVYGIVSMAYQRTPNRVLWCVRSDGKLLGCTYYRDHKVVGWHVHETDGKFESVEVIPGSGRDEVWFIIKRRVDGEKVRYIERLAEEFVGEDTLDSKFMDSHLSYDAQKEIIDLDYANNFFMVASHGYSVGDSVRVRGVDVDDPRAEGVNGTLLNKEFIVSYATTDVIRLVTEDGDDVVLLHYNIMSDVHHRTVAKNITTVSGLQHLEAKTVAIVSDGVNVPEQVVTDGKIVLEDPASVVHVGLPFNSDMWTLTPEIPLPFGPSMSNQKRVTSATVKLHNTLGMQIGTHEGNLLDQQFADDNVLTGQAADLFTGLVNVSLKDEDNMDARVYIRQAEPFPMTILSVESELEIDEVEDR